MLLKPFLAIATICLLAAACTETVRPVSTPLIPVVEKIPLDVAVVYDDALVNHQCVASKGYLAAEWIVQIGPPSIEMLTAAFSALFENVQYMPASKLASLGTDRHVIRISLQNYTGCDVSWPIVGSAVEVAYTANITRGSETVLVGWTGHGKATGQDYDASRGKSRVSWTSTEGDYLARTTEIAIRRGVGDLIANFEGDERVAAWKAAALAGAKGG